MLDRSAEPLADRSFSRDQKLTYRPRIGIICGCVVISWGVIILTGLGVLQILGY